MKWLLGIAAGLGILAVISLVAALCIATNFDPATDRFVSSGSKLVSIFGWTFVVSFVGHVIFQTWAIYLLQKRNPNVDVLQVIANLET